MLFCYVRFAQVMSLCEVVSLRDVMCALRRLCHFVRLCRFVRLCAFGGWCALCAGYCCVAAITARRANTHAQRALLRQRRYYCSLHEPLLRPGGDTTSRRDITARFARLCRLCRGVGMGLSPLSKSIQLTTNRTNHTMYILILFLRNKSKVLGYI